MGGSASGQNQAGTRPSVWPVDSQHCVSTVALARFDDHDGNVLRMQYARQREAA